MRSIYAICRRSLLAIFIFAGFLFSATAISSDNQPVQPYPHYHVGSGSEEVTHAWYDKPEQAWAAYKAWHDSVNPGNPVDNFTECTQADFGGVVYRTNGYANNYCHTQHYEDGTQPVRTSVISLALSCPTEKPQTVFGKTVVAGYYSDMTVSCYGSAAREPAPKECTHECGNPIQVETHTKIERANDIAVTELLRLDRTYSSYGGEWQHNYSTRAWNLNQNSLATLGTNPSPATFAGTIETPNRLIRVNLPYMSNQDIGRPEANDWIAARPDGGRDSFSSITGRSGLGTNDNARVVLDGSNQYEGLVISREKGLVEEFDRDGRLLRRSRLNGGGVVLTYLSPSGQKVPSSAPSCAGVSTGMGTAGNPSCVTDAVTGRQLVFSYGDGKLLSVMDPSGSSVGYTYDGPTANGSTAGYHALTGVTHQDSTTKTYHYNEQALTSNVIRPTALTGVTDENSHRYSFFGYDANGLAASTAHSGGVFSFNVEGNVVTDPLGTQKTFNSTRLATYASGYSIVSSVVVSTGVTRPNGDGSSTASSYLSYDANANVKSRRDFNGISTSYTYDLSRNLETQRVEASGTGSARTISTQWHPDWRLQTKIAEPKRMTWLIYNGQPDPANSNVVLTCAPAGSLIDGKPIAVLCKKAEQATLDLDGSTGFSATLTGSVRAWTYTYNSDGQALTADGPRADLSDVTTYAYYASHDTAVPQKYRRGDLYTVTNAAGHIITFTSYNANGQPLTFSDENGTVTTLTYDPRSRLTSRSVGTELTSYSYWPTGLLKRVTMPDGSYLHYTYDDAHRLTQINDGEGNHVVYTLDNAGNRMKEEIFDPTSFLVRQHHRAFNALSRLSAEIGAANSANVTTSFGYDNNGNQTSTSGPLGRNSSRSYDKLDRVATETDPERGTTSYGYDGLGQLLSVTDPRSLTTTYTVNGLGDLTQQVSPDTGATNNTYDSGGNLKTSTDARNAITTYTYDALNRVTTAAFKLGATTDQTITYNYDAGTNGKGHLTSASDANHSMSWVYDPQGRVTNKTQVQGSVSQSVAYGYTNGLLTSLTTPSGQAVSYAYSNGQISGIAINGTPLLSNVLYDPFGPARQWSWGNGTLSVRTFDQDGKVTQLDSAGLNTYAYDDAFRITGITDTSNSNLSWTYGYDDLDRLTSATTPTQLLGWSYDAVGNRLDQSGNSASIFNISPNSNRLSSTTGALTRTYTYDAAGNIINNGSRTFAYNNRGRMKSTTSGTTVSYTYNALGQRVKKSGTVRLFVYDEAGHLLGEYSSTGALVQETIWLGDTPVATIRPKTGGVNIFYVHADHLNTPRKVTRPSDNKLRWRWDSDAFGNGAPNQNPQSLGAFSYNLRFPGQYYDSETGLHYNYFRDYDPQTGRYPTSDPIGLKGGLNTYAYVSSNPLMRFDALGLVERWYAPGSISNESRSPIPVSRDGGPPVVVPPGTPNSPSKTPGWFTDWDFAWIDCKCWKIGPGELDIGADGKPKSYQILHGPAPEEFCKTIKKPASCEECKK